MARKNATITLGPDKYEVTQLGATEAYDLYNDLVGAIGPALKDTVLNLAKKDNLLPEEQGFVILEFKRAIPKQLMRELREAFTKTTRVKQGAVFLDLAQGDIFDQHFAGRMQAIDLWMIACAKHNFLGFLAERVSSGDPPTGAEQSE